MAIARNGASVGMPDGGCYATATGQGVKGCCSYATCLVKSRGLAEARNFFAQMWIARFCYSGVSANDALALRIAAKPIPATLISDSSLQGLV